jgi:hypothetical protein
MGLITAADEKNPDDGDFGRLLRLCGRAERKEHDESKAVESWILDFRFWIHNSKLETRNSKLFTESPDPLSPARSAESSGQSVSRVSD